MNAWIQELCLTPRSSVYLIEPPAALSFSNIWRDCSTDTVGSSSPWNDQTLVWVRPETSPVGRAAQTGMAAAKNPGRALRKFQVPLPPHRGPQNVYTGPVDWKFLQVGLNQIEDHRNHVLDVDVIQIAELRPLSPSAAWDCLGNDDEGRVRASPVLLGHQSVPPVQLRHVVVAYAAAAMQANDQRVACAWVDLQRLHEPVVGSLVRPFLERVKHFRGSVGRPAVDPATARPDDKVHRLSLGQIPISVGIRLGVVLMHLR